MRTIGSASTALTAAAGTSRNAICLRPLQVPPRREPGQGREEHSRDRHREHSLREHVHQERLLDRGRGEIRVDQPRRKELVDDSVDVDQAEPERDRNHQHEHLPDGGIAPVEHELKPPVAPAKPGHRQENLDERRDQDRERVDVELRAHRVRLRHSEREPDDDREIPEDGRDRRNGEMVVAVEDPDDDARDAQQCDDRKEHARQSDRERLVVSRIAEDTDHPRRNEHVERCQRRQTKEHQPEQARCDAPGTSTFVSLEEVGEDRNEGR
jgi:hypothetical protein